MSKNASQLSFDLGGGSKDEDIEKDIEQEQERKR